MGFILLVIRCISHRYLVARATGVTRDIKLTNGSRKLLNLARAGYVCAGLPIPPLKDNGRDSRCYVRARVRVARCPI